MAAQCNKSNLLPAITAESVLVGAAVVIAEKHKFKQG